MAQLPRHALARSYVLTDTLDATVTDNGGVNRSVTVANTGQYVRAYIAENGGGTTTDDPLELFATAGAALSSLSGGGTWAVTMRPDGRTRVMWTGLGNGEISAGPLLAALGFTATTGVIASGASATSTYPALGLLLWAYGEQDTGWLPEQAIARSSDSLGRTYSFASSYIRWARNQSAVWVPRVWSGNSAGEYLSPAWWGEKANGGTNTVLTPNPENAAEPMSWATAIFSLRSSVAWGYTDDFQALTTGEFASTVYLGSDMLDAGRFMLPEKSPTFAARRDVSVTLTRTGTFEL